jgi:hypothetical protein
VTTWLPDPRDRFAGSSTAVDVNGFALAVADLVAEAGAAREYAGPVGCEALLARRLTEPEFTTVFGGTPAGVDGTANGLLRQVREQPATGGPGTMTLIRTLLLSQIDAVWWGATAPYRSDADLLRADDLVDLSGLRRQGRLRFQYRMQPTSLPTRLVRAAQRRIWPGRSPHTAGLRFSRARPQLVIVLGQVADRFAARAPAGTPLLWVTSLARSVEHQIRLHKLGYPTVLPSAHCVGYAADVEMAWYRQFGADRALAEVLLERRAAGELNVIDEGQVWHVCLHPAAAARLSGDRAGVGG